LLVFEKTESDYKGLKTPKQSLENFYIRPKRITYYIISIEVELRGKINDKKCFK
jgi:hypothetical protein